MRCHDCDRPADVGVESDGIVVGLCDRHLRDHMESLADDLAVAARSASLDAEDR